MNKKHLAAAITAITMGTVGAWPVVASADPVISVPSETEITIGSESWIGGSGCEVAGVQTYGGTYFRIPTAPGFESWTKGMEVEASGGEFGWLGQTADFPSVDMEFAFFCSQAPLADQLDLEDPNLLWLSAPYTRRFVSGPAAQGARQARTVTAPSSSVAITTSTGPGDPGFVVDPDALPQVDRMGLAGPAAAALKAKVDGKAQQVAEVEDFVRSFYGRPATAEEYFAMMMMRNLKVSEWVAGNVLAASKDFTYEGNRANAIRAAIARAHDPAFVAEHADADYVIATYLTVAGRHPSEQQIAAGVATLGGGTAPRVQVVEDVAVASGKGGTTTGRATAVAGPRASVFDRILAG
ncbi:MAG: hypothetical protein R2702_01045 [Acidimicrobiales bacterium]